MGGRREGGKNGREGGPRSAQRLMGNGGYFEEIAIIALITRFPCLRLSSAVLRQASVDVEIAPGRPPY